MYIKFVHEPTGRTKLYEAEEITYHWTDVKEEEFTVGDHLCFIVDPDSEFIPLVEFWLISTLAADHDKLVRVFMDSKTNAHIIKQNTQTQQ